jgi:superfamily II DNA or RNA helicase
MLGRAALPEQWARDKGDKDVEYDSDDMEAEEEATTALLSLPIYRLHGDMPQQERTQTFFSFTGSRRGVLICTDVAARGLDFPKIDWIVQYDPPRDVEEYVHRVGRTARMTTEGDAMLFLMPHEEPYLDTLAQHNIKLKTMSESEARRVLGASRANAPSQKADEDFMSLQVRLSSCLRLQMKLMGTSRPACLVPLPACVHGFFSIRQSLELRPKRGSQPKSNDPKVPTPKK